MISIITFSFLFFFTFVIIEVRANIAYFRISCYPIQDLKLKTVPVRGSAYDNHILTYSQIFILTYFKFFLDLFSD